MSIPPDFNSGFSSLNNKTARWDANIPYYDLDPGKWHQLRIIGPLYPLSQHWFETKNGKRFASICPAYDSNTRSMAHNDKCAVEKLLDMKNSLEPKIKALAPRQFVLGHAIIREIQQQTSHDPNSFPVRPVRLAIGLSLAMANLKGLNQHVIQNVNYQVDITHPDYGADVMVLNNPNAASNAQRYTANIGRQCPLTDLERSYLSRLTDWGSIIVYPSYEEILRSLQMNGYLDNSAYTSIPSNNPGLQNAGFAAESVLPPPPTPPQYQQAAMSPPPPPPPQQYQPQQPPPPMQYQQPVQAQQPMQQAYTQPVQQPAYQPQPQYQQPAQQPIQPGEARYPVAGRKDGVTAPELQQLVGAYAQTLDRGQPMKQWTKDDMNGFQVMNCFGTYQGDGQCMKCPVRKFCLHY